MPFWHAMGSMCQDSSTTEGVEYELGEIPVWEGVQFKVANPRNTGQRWCGSVDDWQLGGIYGQTLRLDAEGVPLCCSAEPLRPGGGAILGQAFVFPSCDLAELWLDPSGLETELVGQPSEFWPRRFCTARDGTWNSGTIGDVVADASGFRAEQMFNTLGASANWRFSTPIDVAQDVTIYGVSRVVLSGSGGIVVSQDFNYDDPVFATEPTGSVANWVAQGFSLSDSTKPPLETLVVYSWRRWGSAWSIWRNGVQVASATGPTNSFLLNFFGAWPAFSALGRANVLELMIVTSTLTAGQDAIIWQYLLDKYGISSVGTYWPALYWPKGYWPKGYWPNTQPAAPTNYWPPGYWPPGYWPRWFW